MIWNPWHGCHKKSAGCVNCYMFRRDALYNKDSNVISKTNDFNLGIRKYKNGKYYIPSGDIVYVCMTSDFFIPEADNWRADIWQMIKTRRDVHFYVISKRIERFFDCIPSDWQDGYDNVTICTTCENQEMADARLPIFLKLPIKHKEVICEPILSNINLDNYLKTDLIDKVTCGGESGDNARLCDYNWILNIRNSCQKYHVKFYFKQTGANFLKDNKIYKIPRGKQLLQANKANINIT